MDGDHCGTSCSKGCDEFIPFQDKINTFYSVIVPAAVYSPGFYWENLIQLKRWLLASSDRRHNIDIALQELISVKAFIHYQLAKQT